jgi:excisionase family DNA binding protein
VTRLEAALAELADAIRDEIQTATRPPDGPDRLFSIDSAATMLALGRSAIYAEIGAGRLKSITIGRSRRVPAGSISAYIAAKSSAGSDDPVPTTSARPPWRAAAASTPQGAAPSAPGDLGRRSASRRRASRGSAGLHSGVSPRGSAVS